MKPESRPSPSLPVRARWCLLGALASLAAFYLVGIIFLDGFALDLGSTGFPAVRYLAFVSFYAFLGGLVAILLALGIARRWGLRERTDAFLAHWNAGTDRRFLVWTSVAAFAIPLLFRFGLLRGAPVADDESAYRFTAQLLASGRLWVPSHELKLFFDQNFIINDGRMFSVYFLGWPALLAAGVRLGATWIVNPLCSALTVAPLFFSLRRFVDQTVDCQTGRFQRHNAVSVLDMNA